MSSPLPHLAYPQSIAPQAQPPRARIAKHHNDIQRAAIFTQLDK